METAGERCRQCNGREKNATREDRAEADVRCCPVARVRPSAAPGNLWLFSPGGCASLARATCCTLTSLFTVSEFMLTLSSGPARLRPKAECYRSVEFSQQRLPLQFQQQELATPAQQHRAAPRTIDGALPLGDVGLRPASSLDLGPSMTASSKSVEW